VVSMASRDRSAQSSRGYAGFGRRNGDDAAVRLSPEDYLSDRSFYRNRRWISNHCRMDTQKQFYAPKTQEALAFEKDSQHPSQWLRCPPKQLISDCKG